MDLKAYRVISHCLLSVLLVAGVNASVMASNKSISQLNGASVSADSGQAATQTMAQNVVVSEQWARATFALAKAGAAYMAIQNTGDSQVHLVSASVDASIAGMVELHHTKMNDGMMQMQELAEGVLIAENEIVRFVPGGKHIMLMALQGPLNAGEELTITLRFADGSEISPTFPIKDARKVNM